MSKTIKVYNFCQKATKIYTTLDYISDIHLECWNLVTKKAIEKNFDTKYNDIRDILCIAGDICNPYDNKYDEFMKIIREYYKQVFIVSGNHEYYDNTGRTIDMIDQRISTICDKYEINYLHKKCVEYADYNFIGCTMWTNINSNNDDPKNEINEKLINDHINIPNFTIETRNELHIEHKKWLKNMIIQSSKPVIVMTHHLPTFNLIHHTYKNNLLTRAFYSDSDDLIVYPVVLWICGHSHIKKFIIKNGIPCVLNPYGYHKENDKNGKNRKNNKLRNILLF